MSRFNFEITQQPIQKKAKAVLPTFSPEEQQELLDFASYKQLNRMKEILAGELSSLDDLQEVRKTHKPGFFFCYLNPSDPVSLSEVKNLMELLDDIEMTMRLDRSINIEDGSKYIWREIKIVEISKNKKRLVLGVAINTEKPLSHQEAWGYSKKVSTETQKQEGESNYENGF
jgi:hypothetical protein